LFETKDVFTLFKALRPQCTAEVGKFTLQLSGVEFSVAIDFLQSAQFLTD